MRQEMPLEARTGLDRGQEAAAASDGYDDLFFRLEHDEP